MLLLGHRGASADAPENTLDAFEEAMRQRADGVELDAMLCATGEVVVCHDERLDRLAGLDWVVQKTPWSKLKEVDVGSRGGRRPARIPLLADVLASLPSDKLVNVELKCERWDDGGLTQRAVEVLRRSGETERILVSSFNVFCLRRLVAVAPEFRCGYLIDPDRSWLLHGRLIAPRISTYSVHPERKDCTPERVRRWHERGLKAAVWTVDNPREARAFQKAGVDVLITNRPGALRKDLFPSR